jgi:flagellar hook protein FlgE
MASEISTIQSLKAVDAWIDVINANINGGVRTAFKASRLKFGGSNTDVSRVGTATSLPLQFPEPGLTTTNSLIDWTQGAVVASSEVTHLAIQGDGFFMLASPDLVDTAPEADVIGGDLTLLVPTDPQFLLTRDGEFTTDAEGFLRTSFGYYLVTGTLRNGVPDYRTTAGTWSASGLRAVYNDVQLGGAFVTKNRAASRLSEFITGVSTTSLDPLVAMSIAGSTAYSLIDVDGKQSLRYTRFGATVYDFGFQEGAAGLYGTINPAIRLGNVLPGDSAILSKSLEASNASMTQSVPELSLAQKLFSALTKVLQTKQTNVDGVLNLVR